KRTSRLRPTRTGSSRRSLDHRAFFSPAGAPPSRKRRGQMDFFDPREPVNAWTHFAWFLLSVAGIREVYRRSRGDRTKQISLLVYGVSLSVCSASSTLFHGVRASA